MPLFSYQARTGTDQLVEGVVEASDENAAADVLLDRNLAVTSLRELRQPVWQRSLTMLERVRARDRVVFFRQLSVLVSANVPIVQALRVLEAQVTNLTLKSAVSALADEVDGGAKLSQAMGRYEHIFSALEVSLIATGETSGKLDEILEYLATQEERDYDLTRKIRGAMIYPTIVVSLMVVVGATMVVFVIPKLTELLTQSGTTLPLPTRLLLGLAHVLTTWWWALLLLAAGGAVAGRLLIATPYGRWRWDSWKLRLPIFGKLLQRVYLVRFCRSLQTLLVGGVSLTQALAIVADVVGNVIYRQVISVTIKEVEDGNSIITALAQSPYVPAIVPQMMAIGEQTGKLDEILEKIAAFYSREVDGLVQNLSSLIEPLVIIAIAGGVGVLFAAVILPIYQLSSGGL
jgi:type II secretory pathway component PulF